MLRRTCLALALALCSAPAPIGAAGSSDAGVAALMAKHRSFVGWQFGDGTFRSMRLERTSTAPDGAVAERVREDRAGVAYRERHVFRGRADLATEDGFTGNVFWSSNANGFTTPIYGEAAKYRLSYALLMNEGTSSLDGTTLGPVTVDGKQLARVRLEVPNADPIVVDVDPATGAYVRAVVDPGGDYETIVRIRSYAAVLPGKRMIERFSIGEDPGIAYTYEKIEPNVAIADADLHPPPQRASWAFNNPKPFPVSVTYTRVLVDAVVNGVKGRFILDTGADSIFLNESFADRAKVAKVSASGTAVGLYGSRPADVRKAASIVIGGNTLSNAIVEAQNFNSSDYFGLDRANYDGLMGYDVFAGTVVRLDFGAGTMALGDPHGEQGDPPGVGVLTDTSLRVPTIPMTVNRTIAVNAILDTGNPGTVVFGPDLLYRYHLRMARNIGTRLGMGSVECGNLDTLQLGPITYSGEQACKVDSVLVPGRRIVVGLDFLRHFSVLFDYPRGRLFLQPQRG